MADSDRICVNGIDAVCGDYLVRPLTFGEGAAIARDRDVPDEARRPAIVARLRQLLMKLREMHYALPDGVDPSDVSQAGWGIVFHTGEQDAVRRALAPLVAHRRERLPGGVMRELEYHDGESWTRWLARHGAAPGQVDPRRVPYYLLVVGSPARIPFSFSQQLDVEYAVGRLHFDTPDAYECYAKDLVEYETGAAPANAREAVFFGTRHPGDGATRFSADLLLAPLADGVEPRGADAAAGRSVAARQGFHTRKLCGGDATKARLCAVLSPPADAAPPALLFTATHGMGWPKGHRNQRAGQGALLCQDWPGLGTIAPEHYFAAIDVPDDARVRGMITFHFACFGGGTPTHDRFFHRPGQPPAALADEPFLAALPSALLSHPNGAALACVGHVERAWACSIVAPEVGQQILPFENALGRLLCGKPVGYAVKDFNEKYATLGNALSDLLERADNGELIAPRELSLAWLGRNDAEGYVVLGDPAARLRASELR